MRQLQDAETTLPSKALCPGENKNKSGFRQAISSFAERAFWRMPHCFEFARLLGPSYSLRCVVFHDVSASESPFTRGMRASITPIEFEAVLGFITRHYTPVSLQDVLAHEGRRIPKRAVLLTFDDGYASIADSALPLCSKFGIPAVIFLNAAYLDNEDLAPDNLICYAINVQGIRIINTAAHAVKGRHLAELRSMSEVFSRFLPSITLAERRVFLDNLKRLGGIDGRKLAREAGLYLTRKQVRNLATLNFEIGNHTYSHTRGRSLTAEAFEQEIDRSKAELETISGKRVRSFSLPYGSSADLTDGLLESLRLSGHEAIFLSESVANYQPTEQFRFDRVSIQAKNNEALFLEIEVLPRLRAIRNHLFHNAV